MLYDYMYHIKSNMEVYLYKMKYFSENMLIFFCIS